MLMASCNSLWLMLVWLLWPAMGMLETGTVSFDDVHERPWKYVSKFAYAVGKGQYEVRAKLRQPLPAKIPTQVNFHVVLDEDWDHMHNFVPCNHTASSLARRSLQVQLGELGEWGPWSFGKVSQTVRPHIAYFIFSSCHSDDTEGTVFSVQYEIRAIQPDGSELSVEQQYMPTVSRLAWLALTVFLARFVLQCRHVKQSIGTVHPVIGALAAAAVLQWAALSLEAFHFGLYKRNGIGADGAKGFAEVIFMMSQTVSATLLIVIGQGYTLSCSNMNEFAVMRPTAAMVTVLQVMLVVFDKFQNGTSCKYHEHEGVVGWVLLAVRLLLYTWFMVGVQKLRHEGGLKLCAFLQRLQFAGTLYFLAYPVIFVFVQVFAPYLRHPMMYVGLLTMQTASAFWLARLFLHRGTYFEVSSLGSSLLPGGGGCYFPAEFKKHN